VRKSVGTLLVGMAIVVASILAIPAPASAAPAMPERGSVCWVQDANFVTYVDDTCEWQSVFKTDENGQLYVLNYHDHGRLPEGAALPHAAMRSIFHVECEGCVYNGDYMQVLMPNGEYMSHGPMNANSNTP
jgi:hypothetical protein